MKPSDLPYPSVSFLAGIFLLSILARSVLGPFLVAIEREMGLSHGASGALFLFVAAGYSATMLLSGFAARLIGHRRTIAASLAAVGAASLAASAAPTPFLLRVALVLLGAGAALYMPSGVATLYRITAPGRWGGAIAIHELGANLAFVLAPLYAELALRLASWRVGAAVLGAAALAGAAGFARFGPAGDQTGEAPRLGNIGVFLREPEFWAIAFPFWLSAALGVGAYSILPVFLTAERGLERGTVNVLLGLSRLTGLPAVFLAGALADRMSPRLLVGLLVGGAGVLAVAIGLGKGLLLIVAVFGLPLATSCFFPAAFAALKRIGRPGLDNIAVSLVVPFGYLFGGGLVPTVMGRLGEDGRFWLGFVELGALALAAAIGTSFLQALPRSAARPPRGR